jgi:alpha-beta hydrolase superfamily lysophospholipase
MHRLVATQAQNAFLRPGADATYADGDDASWQNVDWPAMTRRVQVLGTEINLIDTGGTGPVIVWVHGLGGCWQNWLLNLPAFMRDHRCLALDLPGFGESPLPPDPLSIEYYGRIVDGLCDTLGVERATVVGSSMGGFIGAEVAIKFGTRVDRLVLVSAAGLSIEYQRREPLLTVARVASLGTSRVAAYHRLVVRRPRLRRAAMQTVIRYPERLSPALAYEQLRGSGKPWLRRRARRAALLLLPGPPPRARDAGARRVGRQRHARAAHGRRPLRRPDRPQRPQGHLRGLRPRPDARAADAIQHRALRVPRRRPDARIRGCGRPRLSRARRRSHHCRSRRCDRHVRVSEANRSPRRHEKEPHMQFAVLLYADSTLDAGRDAPEWAAAVPAHGTLHARLTAGGHEYTGAALRDVRTATSLRVRDGERLVTDGPFAETKEQLWGFYLVEAPDLDTVIELTADMWEATHGTVEIRPVIPISEAASVGAGARQVRRRSPGREAGLGRG